MVTRFQILRNPGRRPQWRSAAQLREEDFDWPGFIRVPLADENGFALIKKSAITGLSETTDDCGPVTIMHDATWSCRVRGTQAEVERLWRQPDRAN